MAKQRAFRKAKKSEDGRPTKLTPELQEEIVRYVRGGCYLETAAAACGIGKANLFIWLKKGKENPKSIHAKFRDAVEKAMAAAEARDLLMIGEAGKKNWVALAWRLERKFPSRYGRSTRPPENDDDPSGAKEFNLAYSLDKDEDET